MDEKSLKIRGYVSPEDFAGTDTEKLQNALDTAHTLDINKVIVKGEFVLEDTVKIHESTEVIFDNARVSAKGEFPLFVNAGFVSKQNNIALEDDLIYIKGENSVLEGDIYFYNASRYVVEKLTIKGKIFAEFSRWGRIEYVDFEGENAIILGRGCNKTIIQYINAKTTDTAFVLDTSKSFGEYCVGKDADIHEIILRSSKTMLPRVPTGYANANDNKAEERPAAITLDATEENGFFNCVIDTVETNSLAVEISGKAGELDCERYRDLTVNNFSSPINPAVVAHSATKHCLMDI